MTDDRVDCRECADLAPNGRCRTAMRLERKDVRRGYEPPLAYMPWRCEWFKPQRDAEDQRPGRERFPELWAMYHERFGEAA